MAWHRLHWCLRMIRSKTGRMIIMLVLTVSIAIAEVVYGLRVRSQLLIADGLFSFAEGIALVGSLIALRYAKADRLDAKNTFGYMSSLLLEKELTKTTTKNFFFFLVFSSWARLEILAGLLQEVLLISLSLSIIVDAINKLINPNHIENASSMIFLGSVGVFIGILGLVLFRGYHHDHNIGNEIVEQKKNDFVRSVATTIQRTRDQQNEQPLLEQRTLSAPPTVIIPELIVTEMSTNNHNNKLSEQRRKDQKILPSLNDTYQSAFETSETKRVEIIKEERTSDSSDKQLRVPDRISVQFTRTRSKSGDSVMSSTFTLDQNHGILDDEFQKSRVFATLHALSLHSLVNNNIDFTLGCYLTFYFTGCSPRIFHCSLIRFIKYIYP